MNEKTIERIKELQNSVVLSDEKKKEVKNEIISIIKKCSVDEIRELMNNETKTHKEETEKLQSTITDLKISFSDAINSQKSDMVEAINNNTIVIQKLIDKLAVYYL